MTRKLARLLLGAALLATSGAVVAYAQLTGQITGTITDPSGAAVGTAAITVVNESTGIRWNAKSNQDGIYTVPLLQPGNYRIEVKAPGFRTVSRSGIQLTVAQTAKLDFSLELGSASQSVTVTDTAPLLDASSNAIGGVVTPEKVE